MRIFIYLTCILLLGVSCQKYKSEPYDDWERKLRDEPYPSKMTKMVIEDNWQHYDPLTYLRYNNLEEIYLESDSIPPWITSFTKLKKLIGYNIDDNKHIRSIPDDIGKLSGLEYLELRNMKIEVLPSSLKELKRLRILILSGNNFRNIPGIVAELDSLHMLSFDKNDITEVPEFVCRIKGLQALVVSGNKITRLPSFIGESKQLVFLSLDDNQLDELPESISDLPLLETILLNGNPITKLPNGLFIKPNRLTDISIENTPIEDNVQIKEQVTKLISGNSQNKKNRPSSIPNQ